MVVNFYQLKYFQLAAQTENISHAAARANLSQQAMSYSIASLEKELDTKLFDRIGRRIILNKNGRIVLSYAEQMINAYSAMMSELREHNNPCNKKLSVATTTANVIKNILTAFLVSNDDIYITNMYISPDKLTETIEKDGVDFVISTEPYESPATEMMLLFEERFNLIVGSDHPLASRSHIRLEEVKDCVFAMSLPENAFRQKFDSICKSVGFQPKVILESNIEDTLALAVLKNVAVTVIGNCAVQSPYYSDENSSIISIDDEIAKRPIYLIWKKKDRQPEHWRRFFEFITSNNDLFYNWNI